MATPSPKIILSGMRPTGKLHLGNYWGALSRWLELQRLPQNVNGKIDRPTLRERFSRGEGQSDAVGESPATSGARPLIREA